MYNCIDIYKSDGSHTSYLIADFAQQCYSSRWWKYFVFSIFLVVLYPLGVPLLVFLLLYKSRNRLQASETQLALGFLYESFSRSYWWFELVRMRFALECAYLHLHSIRLVVMYDANYCLLHR